MGLLKVFGGVLVGNDPRRCSNDDGNHRRVQKSLLQQREASLLLLLAQLQRLPQPKLVTDIIIDFHRQRTVWKRTTEWPDDREPTDFSPSPGLSGMTCNHTAKIVKVTRNKK